MSTSKPVISLVIAAKLNRLLPMSNRRSPAARDVGHRGNGLRALVAKGRRLAVGSWLELSGGSGCGGMISTPTGVGSGSAGAASPPPSVSMAQLASTIAKASGARGACARRARRVITDILSAAATGRERNGGTC